MELLPDTQTPSWLGLPNNAEKVLLTTQGGYPRPLASRALLLRPAPWRQGNPRPRRCVFCSLRFGTRARELVHGVWRLHLDFCFGFRSDVVFPPVQFLLSSWH